MLVEPEYIQTNGIVAEVIRTHRLKTADIRVEDGDVSIVVPAELTNARITQILKNKKKWIRGKISLHRDAVPVSANDYVSGESFSYLGRNYRLKVEYGSFAPVKLIQGYLVLTVPKVKDKSHLIHNALVQWYKHHAERKLKDKANRYAAIVGVNPTTVGIKSFKSRWGSCSAKGKIDFNWKIAMAPNRVVDYVVVHELCHLKVHDHSPQFWRLVERTIPDYKYCKDWLRLNAATLEL